MVFVPENAPLVVLGFFATGLLLLAAAGGFAVFWATGRRALAGWLLAGAVVLGWSYVTLLLGFALASEEKILAPGQWKYFCEIDCHLAYAVESVTTAQTLGAGERTATARGSFYLPTVKTWFDERTISARRPKDMPLRPDPRRVLVLVDDQGRSYPVSEEGQRALEEAGNAGAPLTQPLRPGESYTTTLVFDLPADARQPRLLLATVGLPTYFLIGHENSFFHKKTYFRLAP